MPFLASNHYFCKAKSFWEKVPDFVPGFLGETLIGQKWCTLSSAQLKDNEKKKKKLWNHYFSAVIWLWLFSNQSQMWHRNQKKWGSLIVHIGVFDVLNKVFFQKLTGDSFKKTLFFCRFLRFFAFAFKSLIFLCWPFLFLVLNFCVFLFCFLLLLWLDKSGCYVLVSVFVVLGFLVFLWYVFFFCLFLVCFFC